MYIVTFLIELLVLFLLSKQVTQHISSLLHKLTKNRKVTVYLIAFFFLPGTFIHELAHFLMAKILFVPVGSFSLKPEAIGHDIRLGKVMIAKTDFFRRLLIGAAPFILGVYLILFIVSIIQQNQLWNNMYILLICGALIFQIGNTMFSSKKDMKGAIELICIVLFLLLFLYLMGFRIAVTDQTMDFLNSIFQKASIFLLPPVIIDIFLLGLFKVLVKPTN